MNNIKLAINGGEAVRTDPWPSWPQWDARDEQALLDVLHSGHWGSLSGSWVDDFASDFAGFQDAEYCVPVTSGTSALEAIFAAVDVEHGDEVITSSWTFIATATAIFAVGGQPVFVDIDASTLNISPQAIERAITPRTRAIVPVHIGGIPADLDAICDIGHRYGIPVVEDACQAWGSEWRGRRVGALGRAGAFSFQASKNMTAGEGGAVVTNDHALYLDLCRLQNSGRSPEDGLFDQTGFGGNLRMNAFQAGLLKVQLERMKNHMVIRQRNVDVLVEAMRSISEITPVTGDQRVTACSNHLFQVRYNPASFGGRSRADFIRAMNAEGIPCSAGYMPLTRHPALIARSTCEWPTLPEAEKAAEDVVWFTQELLLDQNAMDIALAIDKIHRAWQ